MADTAFTPASVWQLIQGGDNWKEPQRIRADKSKAGEVVRLDMV
jgi:hypothetical protein